MRSAIADMGSNRTGILSPARLPIPPFRPALTSRTYEQKREDSFRRHPAQSARFGPFRPIFTRKYTHNRPPPPSQRNHDLRAAVAG